MKSRVYVGITEEDRQIEFTGVQLDLSPEEAFIICSDTNCWPDDIQAAVAQLRDHAGPYRIVISDTKILRSERIEVHFWGGSNNQQQILFICHGHPAYEPIPQGAYGEIA